MTFTNSVVGNGGSLVRTAIRSPNYVAGTTGWTINKTGDAEFNNLNIRGTFTGTDFVISSAGAFFYDGTPANGNLIASISANAGTDAFGNDYPSGIGLENDGFLSVYNGSGNLTAEIGGPFGQVISYSQTGVTKDLIIRDGVLQFGDANTSSQWAQIFAEAGANGLQIASPTSATLGDQSKLRLFPGTTGTSPYVILQDGARTVPTNFQLTGAITKSVPTSPETAYTWQTPTFNTNWAAGSAASALYQPLQFRLTAEDEVWIYGAVKATLAAPSNTIFTLPTGYRPGPTGGTGSATIFAGGSLTQVTSGDVVKATGRVNIMSSGVVVIGGFTVALGDSFYFNHKIPLGNIA